MYKSRLSGHASYRINKGDEQGKRTTLSRKEVRKILDEPSKHILLGVESEISYILFYSKEDERHYIVIKNETKTGKGKVITLKPLKYYKGPFPIEDRLLEKAEKISFLPRKEIKV